VRTDRKQRPKVLVIDDNEIDRTLMTEVLRTSGFEVHALPTAIGATRLARQEGVSIVVIDQNMPSMSGSKLAVLFRDSSVLRHIRFVLVSGDDPETMRVVAYEAGADEFVEKRRARQDLAAVVTRLSAAGARSA
jgi:CheY-like chemotaxis protein